MSRIIYVVLILYSCHCLMGVSGNSLDGVVTDDGIVTDNGVVKGHLVNAYGISYMAYLGIPYAAPPVGGNRFKAPLPPTPWRGILEANRTVQCPQSGTGDEDCLVMNVFTPAAPGRHLPVLVFIHGGAFYAGAGPTEGMEHLLKHDLVVVTFNYRIGTLGFLCLGTEEAPGNAGLKDQVAALRWVASNIISFGGDPRQVTIYGSSAGGASVDLQVLSSMSDGLFSAAIAESGSATSSWSVEIDPIASATKLAGRLNFSAKSVEDLTRFYQTIPADMLTVASAAYHSELLDGSLGFAPCIEKRLPGIQPFITESPYDLLVQGKYDKIRMMLIYSTLEGLYVKSSQYYQQNYKEKMEANFEDFLPLDLIFESEEMKTEVASEIKTFYFGNETIDDNLITKYLEYFSDFLIMHGVLTSAEFHSLRSPVYLMEFAYKSGVGAYDQYYHDITVAGHSDASRHAILGTPITNDDDQRAVDTVTEIISNFVKYGNPSPQPSALIPVPWPRVDPQKLDYLLFSQDLTVGEQPHWPSKLFWDQLYAKYRKQLTAVNPVRTS